MNNQNPESLHDVAHETDKKVSEKFVNPGTPDAPVVTREQMTQATIKGNASDVLRSKLIK